jgi:hypothetical protein
MESKAINLGATVGLVDGYMHRSELMRIGAMGGAFAIDLEQ